MQALMGLGYLKMKYNVYDFDKTIYKRDATFDFYLFCIKKRPRILTGLPALMGYAVLYAFKGSSKTEFKEIFYRFLRHLGSVDELVTEFWDQHRSGIAEYYHEVHRDSDVVISASPEFLLEPICRQLQIHKLIASRVDKHTGIYFGENCWGAEKVSRFRDELPGAEVGDFYSDSLSDAPMAAIAERAFLVTREGIVPWPGR